MSIKIKFVLAAVIAFILFVSLRGSDFVHKIVDPVSYATEQLEFAKEMVEFYKNEVQSICHFEIRKLQLTRDINMRQSMLAGSSQKEALIEFQAEWEATTETCNIMRELLRSAENDLKIANQELAISQ